MAPSSDEGDARPEMGDRLGRLESLLAREARGAGAALTPAWRRLTEGEPRWPVTVAILAALALELSLPRHLVLGPKWLLPALGAMLLVALVAANPGRIDRRSAVLRGGSLVLIAVLSLANAWSAGRLVVGLVNGTEHAGPSNLLLIGGAIWLTNVIVFALWYWEFDRGGPVARALGSRPHPDFLFPQMQNPELAPAHWEPRFVDYLYLSFTNATAFSPTDVMPLSRWGKVVMLVQSAISLMTVALVVARAVNILK
jgi:uncharacterized membrane protein